MRLYHSTFFLVICLLLAGCLPSTETPEVQLVTNVTVDGQTMQVQVPPGSTVQEALDTAGVTLETMDRVEPPTYSVLTEADEIVVTRVWEEFEIEQVVIPFEQQQQPSEFLADEETRRIQEGQNGLREITYRSLFEDGVEVSRNPIKNVVVQEPIAEIWLVGVQSSYTPLPIPGRLFYIVGGNAWMMEGTTANRVPVITSGDLDGRVFEISDDGDWILFTRQDESEETINTLWALQISEPENEYDLQISNVIHFADWAPGSNSRFVYSTVEPRQAAPGWQANNDLVFRDFSRSGWVSRPDIAIETNSGGIYGWWGTEYGFISGSQNLYSTSPSAIKRWSLSLEIDEILLEVTPLQTRSDWAWVPGVGLGPDLKTIYTVDHAPPPGAVSPEESPIFDLVAIPLETGSPITLVSQVGMFSYPLPSPIQPQPSGEDGFMVAYLQAIFPTQSDTSRYRLAVMDRDGSNRHQIFPPQDASGIDPSRHWGVWSPQSMAGSGNYVIALIYQGNIWLVDPETEESWQITGDGGIQRLVWQ